MLFYVAFQWGGAMKNGSMTFFCQWVLDNSFFNTASLGDAWGLSLIHICIVSTMNLDKRCAGIKDKEKNR